MADTPQRFPLSIPEGDIDDLRARLASTRFPDQAPGASWTYGADVTFIRMVVTHWCEHFDWRTAEERLNAFPQFAVPIDGTDIHFLHVPGNGLAPIPMLLSHGWPGSVFGFLEIILRLTGPRRFGGDPADAVTVISNPR